MIQFDLQVQINDLLTQFLQQFKNIFAAKMSLIQSLVLTSNSLQSNPQYLLSRLSTKIFKMEWPLDPYSLPITHEMTSNIQRFYLRIQQYLEFRLSTLLNLDDKVFNKQIDSFRKGLLKVIASLENQTVLTPTAADFLYQLSKCEKTFTSRLIDIISNKNSSLIRGPIDYQSLSDIRNFIQSKICKEQFEIFKERNKILLPPSRDKKWSLRENNEQPSRLKSIMRKKISSKLEVVRQSLPPRNVIVSMQDNNFQQNNWDSKSIIPEDETLELQSYVQKQNKIRFNKAYDILDIQIPKNPVTKQEIMADLEGKNAKNKTCIDGFIHKYEKKQRRSLRRERSEKQSKSTAKSSKYPSKAEDKNIFSIRMQKSQHQYLPNFKINLQPMRKYEQFELPLILNRNNRRTTVQK